jgi:hypothetical protein
VGVIKTGASLSEVERRNKERRGASGGANGPGPTARRVGNRYYGDANMQLPKDSNGARAPP